MRLFAATAAAVCMTTPAFALECDAGLRAFTHQAGETCIPQNPQRIATTHGYTATPLLELGAAVIATTGSFDNETGETQIRYAYEVYGTTLENAGLTAVGVDGTVDFELLIAAEPDLIILEFWGADDYEKYAEIAPTVVESHGFGFEERMQFMAAAAGVESTLTERLAQYDARVADARAAIGDTSQITISRLDIWEGKIWHYRGWGALAKTIEDLGFAEPELFASMELQEAEFSGEVLDQADGDILLSSYAIPFGQTIEMLSDDWDNTLPFWRDLAGVQSGGHYWIDRNVMYSETFAGLNQSLDLLVTLTAGHDFE